MSKQKSHMSKEMKLLFSLILFAWSVNCSSEGKEQVELLKVYFNDLQNPLNEEDETLLLNNVYQAVKNLSYEPDRSIHFSLLLPFILELEKGEEDTRFTRLFFNACHCARSGIEGESLLHDLLWECLKNRGEISDSRYINSISTALDQATLYKSDYVLPDGDDKPLNLMIKKLNRQLMMP